MHGRRDGRDGGPRSPRSRRDDPTFRAPAASGRGRAGPRPPRDGWDDMRAWDDADHYAAQPAQLDQPAHDDWDDYADQGDNADDAAYDDDAGVRPSRALRTLDARPPVPLPLAGRALAPRRARGRVELPSTGGVIVPGTHKVPAVTRVMPVTKTVRPHWRKRMPIWIAGNLVALVVLGLLFVAPSMTTTAAAAACGWYTVKSGDTLADIGTANNSSAPAIAAANHIAPTAKLYVGQKLCVPTAWYAAASAKPYVPPAAKVALPTGILAGEPCTSDRSIVWTGVIGRWTIPPGCFGLVYYPDPAKYMVNGREIGGFGWCNWWPEALLRNPNALDKPGHPQPRVGVPVFYAPQPGESVGHYAFVESIGQGKYAGWILISEMNMYWRGAGWAKVDYRYIRVDYPGANYLY